MEHDSFIKFPIENATYEFEQILKEDLTYILMQNIREVINDHVTCTRYCKHRMNRFHILLKATTCLVK